MCLSILLARVLYKLFITLHLPQHNCSYFDCIVLSLMLQSFDVNTNFVSDEYINLCREMLYESYEDIFEAISDVGSHCD